MAAVAAAAKAPWSQTRLNFGSSGSVGDGTGMGGNKTQARSKAAKKEGDKKTRGEVKPQMMLFEGVSLTSSTLDGVSGFRFVDEALSISLEGFTGTITLNKVLAPSSPKTTKKRKMNEDVPSRTAAFRNDDKIPIYSQASMAMDADDDDNDAEGVDCTPFPQNPPVEPEMPSSPSSSSSQVSVVCGGESLGLIDETPSASPPPKTQVVPADSTTRPHSVRRSRQVREDSLLAKQLQEEELRSSKASAKKAGGSSARFKWLSVGSSPSRNSPRPRWGHAATLIKSDPPTVLITGGDAKDANGPLTLSDSLLYTASSHSWKKAHGNTALARAFHTANVVQGATGRMLVVFGGENNTPGKKEVLGSPLFMDLDEKDSIWFEPNCTGNCPPPRAGHTCVLAEGSMLLVFGGEGEDGHYNDMHVLDTTAWNWFVPPVSGDAPSPRAYHTSVMCGSKMVVIAGGDKSGNALGDVHALDVNTWEWEKIVTTGDAPGPCCGHSAAVLPSTGATAGDDGSIVIFGGWDANGQHRSTKVCHVLDSSTWAWRKATPDGQHPVECAGHTFTALPDVGQCIVFGGQSGDESLLDALSILKFTQA